jgi:hypothetical protein
MLSFLRNIKRENNKADKANSLVCFSRASNNVVFFSLNVTVRVNFNKLSSPNEWNHSL